MSQNQKTIFLNGRQYDAVTGLPVELGVAQQQPRTSFAASRVHGTPQHSTTLNRKFVHKDITRPAPKHEIHKFATSDIKPNAKTRVIQDVGPIPHPLVEKANRKLAEAKSEPAKPVAIKPAREIKQAALKEALAKAPEHHERVGKQHKVAPKKSHRLASITMVALSLAVLGGYFTYLNMPNLTVKVAAAQAGVEASYPSYRPDGYGRGQVAYGNGMVRISFRSNAGPLHFSLVQRSSSWDSLALRDNFVEPEWGDNIDIVTDSGLTIYRKDSDAAWVNDGMFYLIEGDAPLTPAQIRRIAVSL